MKLHILSDLHLEFGKWPRRVDINAIDADVTVLAGDIGVGLMGIEWALTIQRPVIYVAGNHEFYGQRPMGELRDKARAKAAGTNVHLLENEAVIIDGVRFLGCTLWTDFCLLGQGEQERCMREAAEDMTDYSAILVAQRGGFGRRHRERLTPKQVVEMHEESRGFLQMALDQNPLENGDEWERTVVVTHHAPCATSLGNGNDEPEDIDCAYASRLETLVAQADLWILGHTHTCVDYVVAGAAPGRGRVVANQRGYIGAAVVAEFRPDRVVDLAS
jgi:predicted phosphodiesterase